MQTVLASPTKRFFVDMLTRDIELTDAILDLLDNCLDGAVRSSSGNPEDGPRKYEKFWAKIDVSSTQFMMRDNCGGIPLETAEKYAFRMGRGPDLRDADHETVGMYGIGMKRALFKLGRDSIVTSNHKDHRFSVHIPPNWTDDDSNWTFDLTIEAPAEGEEYGTEILTEKLREGIATTLGDSSYQENLINKISQHYSLVLERGFKIYVNDVLVTPSTTTLLYDEEGGIVPATFHYQDATGQVEVFFAVGLNAPAEPDPELVPEPEQSAGPMERKRSYKDGGWTIFCNERAVLVKDKTITTGWGDGIAQYHDQYAVISGLVQFRAKDATLLPVTTTKRGLDTNSALWMSIRSEMIKAIDPFIKYTNKWKNTRRKEQDKYFKGFRKMDLEALKAHATSQEASGKATIRRRGLAGAVSVIPNSLPSPEGTSKTTRRVVFTREISEIKEVAEALFGEIDRPPGEVGDRCFSIQLEKVREQT